MTLLAALWAGMATADLVRWSPDLVSPRRRTAALLVAAATAALLALLLHDGPWRPDAAAATAAGVLLTGALGALVWVGTTSRTTSRATSPRAPLGALAGMLTLTVLAAPLAGSVPPASPAGRWWTALAGAGLPRLGEVTPDQALLALTGVLALLGTGNRVVRLVLAASGTSPAAGEASLRGGRLLGPLERVFLLALALGGDLTAAAAVIAAKGLLRLPEVRTASRLALAGQPGQPTLATQPGQQGLRGADVVTEYFLVGTFTSWLLALGVAGAVVLAGA